VTNAGIDIGAKATKVVILKDGQVLARHIVLAGFDTGKSADQALGEALQEASLSRDTLEHITATGTGRKQASFAHHRLTEVAAAARGTHFLLPSVRTIIDVGAEEGRAIKCDAEGRVIDFVINDKCAAGSGAFMESMARALEVGLEEFSNLSLRSQNTIPMNAQCVIFAESEVVSLIHAKAPKEDIARAVTDAIARRVVSIVRRVGVEQDIAVVGGLARNVGFVKCLKESLEVEVLVPDEPEFVCALGAALSAPD